MKPLFLPLKRAYFEAFARGEKAEEFRPYGPRWNEETCIIGRPVVLSLGYGKRHRLAAIVTGFRTSTEPTTTPAWRDCYGDRAGLAACVSIVLEPERLTYAEKRQESQLLRELYEPTLILGCTL